MNKHWSNTLPTDTCKPALKWARTQPSLETAWQTCRRGDWMMQLLVHCNVNRKLLVKTAALCAEPATRLIAEKSKAMFLQTIQTCMQWAEGNASDDELHKAAEAAKDTATTVCAWWDAADAAWAAARTAVIPACAVRTVHATVNAAAELIRLLTPMVSFPIQEARPRIFAQSADIIRGVFSKPPKI